MNGMHRTQFWVLYHSESVHACFDHLAHLACMFCFIASSLLYKCCSVQASLSVRIRRSKRLFLSFLVWLSFSPHTVPQRLRVLAHVLTVYVKVIFLINITSSLVPLARVFQMIAYVNLASKSTFPCTQFVWTSEYSIKWIITMYFHLMINTANFCVKTL